MESCSVFSELVESDWWKGVEIGYLIHFEEQRHSFEITFPDNGPPCANRLTPPLEATFEVTSAKADVHLRKHGSDLENWRVTPPAGSAAALRTPN